MGGSAEAYASIGLYVAYIITIVACVSAIVLPALSAIKNPAGLFKSLFGLIGLVVIFFIAYALSDSTVTPVAASMGVDAGGSKVIGAGLLMFYIVFFVAIAGILYSEINKALK